MSNSELKSKLILAFNSEDAYNAYKKWQKNMVTIENGYSLSNYIDFYYIADEHLQNPNISETDKIRYTSMRDLSICGIFSSSSTIGKNFTPTTTSLESQLVKLINNNGISDQPIGSVGSTAYFDFLNKIVSQLHSNSNILEAKISNMRISIGWKYYITKEIEEEEYLQLMDLTDKDNYSIYLQEIKDEINARNEFNQYKDIYILKWAYMILNLENM